MPQYHKSVLYTSDILIVKCKERRPPSDKWLKGWPISDHLTLLLSTDTLLKPNKMFLTFFVQFPTIIPFKSYAKRMTNTVILTLPLKLVGYGTFIEGLVCVKHCMGTESSPVFHLRTEDFQLLLVKSAPVSIVLRLLQTSC